jgi:hypothetical protein
MDNHMSQPEPVDRVLLLLFLGVIIFTGILFAAEVWFMQDSQMFQVVAGILTGFTGAFFGRMKPGKQDTQTASVPAAPVTVVSPVSPVSPDQKTES